jgi:hemoglobin
MTMQKLFRAHRIAAACAGLALAASSAYAQDAAPMDAPAKASPSEAANAGATPIAGDEVYKAFHEQAGIQRVMDDFIVRVTTDPRIMARFQGANLPRLKILLVQQVCYLTGGPCVYGGRDMKDAHAGMNLEAKDFNALAEDLQLSMDKEQVPFRAQNQLLAKLAPMERPIVTK